ncbi:SF1B family DNA helicase RecD2 [Paucibacter soli]|uniref:SF1B family DNA helicase RecD2 n=1 Tax=Paucibacter soli TaxID=3133433 RepID=UPI0030AFDBAD
MSAPISNSGNSGSPPALSLKERMARARAQIGAKAEAAPPVQAQVAAPAPAAAPTPAATPFQLPRFRGGAKPITSTPTLTRPGAPSLKPALALAPQALPKPSAAPARATLWQTRAAPAPKPAEKNSDLVDVSGKIVRVLFGADGKSSKVGLLVQGKTGAPFKLQGTLTCEAEVGRRISAKAVLEEHPKFGAQYVAQIITEQVPIDRDGAVAYMVRALDGVGQAVANKLYDVFGESIFDVIQHQPKRLLGVGGVTEPKLKRITDSWAEDLIVRNIWDFLSKHGINGEVAARIYAKFGNKAMEVAQKRPYELATVEGVGFDVIDKIAAGRGIRADSSERIAGAIEYLLEATASQGHTAKPMGSMVDEVQKLTGLESDSKIQVVEDILQAMVTQGRLVPRSINGSSCLALASVVEMERGIAQRLKILTDAGKSDDNLVKKARAAAVHLKDADQSDAVTNVFASPVSVITGRPGCGKSTVTRVIKDVALAAGLKVVMCAPTGKAARRMEDASGHPADTMHAKLGYQPEGEGGFIYDASNPLKGDIFLLDEFSMSDTALTRAFLDAIPKGARVVFIGDVDQLASVGPGAVLLDLIESGKVSVTRLQTIHRTAMDSDIVVNAHKIINGDFEGLDLQGKKDFRFHGATDEAAIRQTVLEKYLDMVDRFGIDNVQILAAQKNTTVGVDALNELIRPIMNPASPSKPEIELRGWSLRLGDRVMRTSNNKKLKVSNGEVGVISAVDVENKSVTVDFGDRSVVHTGKELRALIHAYATTVHKSQGSEYAGVLTVVAPSHRRMLNRSIIYTGMTRGKKQSDIVGDLATLKHAVSKPGLRRWTGLADEIRRAFGDAIPTPTLGSSRLTPAASSPTIQQAAIAAATQASTPGQRTSLFRRPRA